MHLNPLNSLDWAIPLIGFDHFDLIFNYYVLSLVYFFWPLWHELRGTVDINAYNFLNNGLIFNPLALLELSQCPLCISIISCDLFNVIFFYISFNHFGSYENEWIFIGFISCQKHWNMHTLYQYIVIECVSKMLKRLLMLYMSPSINSVTSNSKFYN